MTNKSNKKIKTSSLFFGCIERTKFSCWNMCITVNIINTHTIKRNMHAFHSIRIHIHIHNSMRWKTTTTNFIEATLTRAREIIIIEIQMAFYIAIGCKLCTARWMNQSIWKMMAKFLIKFYRICLGYGWRWSKIDMYGISVDKSNVNWVEFRFSKKTTDETKWQRIWKSICHRFIELPYWHTKF